MTTLLLMGHGSRDPEGLAEYSHLVRSVQSAAPGYRVACGWLEFAGPGMPTIQDAIAESVEQGEQMILAVPVLLHRAGHSRADMPMEIARARTRFPYLDLRGVDYLGTHPGLLEITEERVREIGQRADEMDTAVVLVGRGSSDPEANADFFKIGRLLWERNDYRYVECCFVSLSRPDVPEGIRRCVSLGARRVLLIPYFLNTGVLVKRIATQADEARRRFPNVELVVGGHLGVHPRLVDVILECARTLEMAGPAPEPAVSGVG